jgi:hypothetical protein
MARLAWFLGLLVVGVSSVALAAAGAPQPEAGAPQAGAEVPYPKDVTVETLGNAQELARLEKPGEVFFQDGFDTADSLKSWFDVRGSVKVVQDAALVHTGPGVLQMDVADQQGKEAGAGVDYWFAPGYDVVYFRRYIKFAGDYDQGDLHHVGGSLYAVPGSDKWAGLGQAGIKPTGDDRFGASFEPWRDWKRNEPPGAMMLYTYWMDMKIDKDGHYWGNNLMPPKERQVLLERGVWHCLEHMIRANTVGKADGEMAAWIDGKLYIHLTGFRWRTSADVKLKRAGLGLYVHQSTRANRVWCDDVALSTGYIGTVKKGTEAAPR